MGKLGVKGKLLLLISMAVLAFMVLAIYSISNTTDLKGKVEFLGKERIPLSITLGDIREGSNAVPRFMWLSLAFPPGSEDRTKSIQKVGDYLEVWVKGVERLSSFNLNEEGKAKVAEIKELMPKLIDVVESAKKSIEENSIEKDEVAKSVLISSMPPLALRLTTVIRDLSTIVNARNESIINGVRDDVARSQVVLIALTLVFGTFLLAVGIVFSIRLSRQLLEITQSVDDASLQVSAASTQLSNASNQLSTASQEQAAATEETSASLTQISSMVDANVKGAERANELASNVFAITEVAKRYMEDLKGAMNSIFESNRQIEQLVKVIEGIGEKTTAIDDIVFKTQLLSFNASVEAKRAGEHGRGFAVVAQEVGNLAQMSGTAATEIAEIVKRSISEAETVSKENKARVEKGEALAIETGEKMTQVMDNLAKILDSTRKIVSASKEQSQGVGQISSSVREMKQATQDIANTASESATASEELAEQAQSLLKLVQNLHTIVTGSAVEEMKAKAPGRKSARTASEKSSKVIPFSDRQKKDLRSPAIIPKKPTALDDWDKL